MEPWRIDDIKIKARHRKDLGDLESLAKSIDEVGLLHPPVLMPDGTLIAGERRIEAAKKLGWIEIPASVAANLTEAGQLLQAEADENRCRKDFMPSEAGEVSKAIRAAYRPVAEQAQAEGQKAGASSGGKAAGRGRPKASGVSCPKGKRDESTRASSVAAKAVGKSRRTLEKIEAVVASGDQKLIATMDKTGKVNGVYKRLVVQQAAEEIRKEPPPLPVGPFRVIVVDPPWSYSARPDDPSHRAANPYPSMSIEEIAAIPVGALAGDDAILWLWTTNSHIPHAWQIVEAWGFEYKTMLTWAKNRMGTGDWLRGQTEHCLMCVKGKPVVTLTNQTTLLNGPLRAHSQKPEEFYQLVEQLCPGSKVELFSRNPRDGWECHGNEVPRNS